jgi:hypothetical protein
MPFEPQAITRVRVMKRKSRVIKSSQLVRHGEEPEDSLWRNVVLQAIADATLKLPALSQPASLRRQMESIREQARRWVKAQGEDFKYVCDLAGLEAWRVHAFAMEQIRKAIDKENARIVQDNFVKGSKPEVGENISEGQRDRLTQATQEIAKIDFPEIGN